MVGAQTSGGSGQARPIPSSPPKTASSCDVWMSVCPASSSTTTRAAAAALGHAQGREHDDGEHVLYRDSCRRRPWCVRDHDAHPRAGARPKAGARAPDVAVAVFVPTEITMVDDISIGHPMEHGLQTFSYRQLSLSSVIVV